MPANAYRTAWLKRYHQRPDVREREVARNREARRRKREERDAARLVVAASENPDVPADVKAELLSLWKDAQAPPGVPPEEDDDV
jgi:hypothetical protein